MRRIPIVAACILLALPVSLHARKHSAQDKPIRMRHLQGRVVDRSGFPVEYAEVELDDAQDHRQIASTFADANGKFFFDDRKRGQHLEIRASGKGFSIARYEVVIVRFGGAQRLRVVLPPAA